MKQYSKLSSEHQQTHASEQQTRQAAPEFANAEELLRYDAAHVEVPPGIAQRLAQSSADLPAPGKSWWKKLFKN